MQRCVDKNLFFKPRTWLNQRALQLFYIISVGLVSSRPSFQLCCWSRNDILIRSLFNIERLTPYSLYNKCFVVPSLLADNSYQEHLDYKIQNFNSTDDREAGEEPHSTTNSWKFCFKVCLFILGNQVKSWRCQEYLHPAKLRLPLETLKYYSYDSFSEKAVNYLEKMKNCLLLVTINISMVEHQARMLN